MTGQSEAPRRLRADAQRNRERLLEVARAAFMQHGVEASLDDIAKQSGVGSATLYRHYPTREALIEAVYAREVRRLGALGGDLANSKPPLEALHTWMLLFVDHVAEKLIIAPALDNDAYESASVVLYGTIERLVQQAIASGDLRSDVVPLDLLMTLIGFAHMNQRPDWRDSARRLIDILLRGTRTEPRQEPL